MTHLLVTNDFPPKIGGIQSYLYELWRRLPPGRFGVLTIAHEGAEAFDARQDFPIRRLEVPMLRPRRAIAGEIESYASELGATLVVLDPVLPIGLVGKRLSLPYALVVHGAEVKIPGLVPIGRQLMHRAITGARLVVAAGGYPAAEVRSIAGSKTPPTVIVPPGVDNARFHPIDEVASKSVRERYGIGVDDTLVVAVSRLVPRKGMDVLIAASARLRDSHPELRVLIGGSGRDATRLRRLIAHHHAPVELIGQVDDGDLAPLYGAADIAAMVCRNRWLGLEQEGFGIVFLEAAASGTPTLAGASGGATEAVVDGETGRVVMHPSSVAAVAGALDELVGDRAMRERYGEAGRARAVASFDYDRLSQRLDEELARYELGG